MITNYVVKHIRDSVEIVSTLHIQGYPVELYVAKNKANLEGTRLEAGTIE